MTSLKNQSTQKNFFFLNVAQGGQNWKRDTLKLRRMSEGGL